MVGVAYRFSEVQLVIPQAGLPNPASSRAVLVGVSEYTDLPSLPAVANNVATLRRVITDADLWGLPDEHCVTLLNPTSVEEVLDAVHVAASAAEDALLFYFAGHGLLDDDRFDLHLALPSADTGRLFRAVRYDDVRREVVGNTRAPAKVVILDCCFSGRALQGGMSGSVDLADHARVDGTYLMTATAETKLALAPPGEEYTAFTGALLDKLQHGLPNGPDLLDMETLFYHVRADLQARRLPVPQQRTRNDGKAIALVRNRRGGRAAAREFASRPRELPQPPAAFDTVLRQPPRELAKLVAELRESGNGDTADQLLAASAALRADQEVAAIIDLLRLAQRRTELRQVITAAALRPPAEVLGILDALQHLDLPVQAWQLLGAVAAGQAGDVAGLARLLQGRQQKEALEVLLDAALDTAQEQSALIGLVSTLWVAGLREEVDGLINRAVSKLPGSAVVDLADELRAVGREEAAFGLYAVAATSMARRSPEAVAQLCQAMTSAGRTDSSDKVATAVIDAGGRFLDLMVAFWETEQDGYADQALEKAAVTLPVAGVVALAAELRGSNREEAAFRLCLRAAVHRSADEIHTMVAALRDVGRPVDANKLLAAVAGQAPVRTVVTLLDRFAEADRQRVLAAVVERAPRDVAELLDRIGSGHPLAGQLSGMIAASAADRPQLLPVMIRQVDPPAKERLLASAVATRDHQDIVALMGELPIDDAKLVMFLVVLQGNPMLDAVVSALRSSSDSADGGEYLLDQPVFRFGQLLDGLRAAGLDRYGDAVLHQAADRERGDQAIASQVAAVFVAGHSEAARELLAATLAGRNNQDLKQFIQVLRHQNQPDALAGAAAWVRTTYARIGHPNVNDLLRQLGLREFADRRWGRK